MRLRRFVIGRGGTVIADLRIGENNDLPGVGRIRKDLLISGYRGIEDYFAGTFGGRTKTPALEDCPVFQGEDGGWRMEDGILIGSNPTF